MDTRATMVDEWVTSSGRGSCDCTTLTHGSHPDNEL